MARLTARERNQANVRGIVPTHLGTQYVANATVTNQTVTILTVAAGQIVLVHNSIFRAYLTAGGVAVKAYGLVYKDGETYQLGFLRHDAASEHLFVAQRFWPPIELETGDKITVVSEHPNITAYVSVVLELVTVGGL